METGAGITATPEPLGRAWARSVLHPVDMEPLGTATAMVTDEAIVVDAGTALVQMTCTAPWAGDRAAAAEAVAAIRSRLALALSTAP